MQARVLGCQEHFQEMINDTVVVLQYSKPISNNYNCCLMFMNPAKLAQ